MLMVSAEGVYGFSSFIGVFAVEFLSLASVWLKEISFPSLFMISWLQPHPVSWFGHACIYACEFFRCASRKRGECLLTVVD
jgi:hypothetical protein